MVDVCGTSSAGFRITLFPQTSAGNIFQVGMASGKLNGVIRPGHADGPAIRHGPLVPQLAGHGVAEQAAALDGGVVRRVDALLHVAARLVQDLAHLPRHGVGDLLLAFRQQVADAAQHIAPQRRRRPAPLVEAALRRLNRLLQVVTRGTGERADQIVRVGRVPVLERAAALRVDPLACNEILERLGHFACPPVQ
jgi:hypothetical protein